MARLFGYSLTGLVNGINRSENQKKSNIQIDVMFNVAATIEHPILGEAIERINNKNDEFYKTEKGKKHLDKSSGDRQILDKKEWREKLIENYKKKHKDTNDYVKDDTRYVWERIRFNIKNNILWKNGEVFFGDVITHTVSVPYKYNDEDSFFSAFPAEVEIRLNVVNGIIKLQVGNFHKNSTPKFLQEEGLATYQTWYTVASLPLMYIAYGIPTQYLNPCAEAMDSWWELWHSGKASKESQEKWRKEWQQINKEIKDYEYVSSRPSDETLDKESFRIISDFGNKLKAYRQQAGEDLKSNQDKSEDKGYTPAFLRDDSTEYTNKYLHVSIIDYNEYKENKGKYMFSDYWEEHP